jgi:SlyX protein
MGNLMARLWIVSAHCGTLLETIPHDPLENPMEERLTELEIKSMHQEKTIQELNDMVYRQELALERLQLEVQQLRQQLLTAARLLTWPRKKSPLRPITEPEKVVRRLIPQGAFAAGAAWERPFHCRRLNPAPSTFHRQDGLPVTPG